QPGCFQIRFTGRVPAGGRQVKKSLCKLHASVKNIERPDQRRSKPRKSSDWQAKRRQVLRDVGLRGCYRDIGQERRFGFDLAPLGFVSTLLSQQNRQITSQ